ncbi:hypothetical protein M9H77_11787 [Catharanthus roseus]|uniref:Uncharacterized protein n=1 Tax=Catharanthus roseus TaxID=4058 RepID=A0ACC0BFQ6_CATRO|nr:hypothetical protein M9H77_11787 [Catharanthus roseus]
MLEKVNEKSNKNKPLELEALSFAFNHTALLMKKKKKNNKKNSSIEKNEKDVNKLLEFLKKDLKRCIRRGHSITIPHYIVSLEEYSDECMGGKHPITMMTDQSTAMAATIGVIFPMTRSEQDFVKLFNHVLKDTDTVPEFEFHWKGELNVNARECVEKRFKIMRGRIVSEVRPYHVDVLILPDTIIVYMYFALSFASILGSFFVSISNVSQSGPITRAQGRKLKALQDIKDNGMVTYLEEALKNKLEGFEGREKVTKQGNTLELKLAKSLKKTFYRRWFNHVYGWSYAYLISSRRN